VEVKGRGCRGQEKAGRGPAQVGVDASGKGHRKTRANLARAGVAGGRR
jgi:hypothetical protein